MIVFPAIDLKGGEVVRLAEGDMDRATIYGDDPAAQAMIFADAGAEHLHVVDLDGSFAGEGRNVEAVKAIIERFPGYVQLGGGIRDAKAVENRFNLGVARVVMGSAALKDPEFVKEMAREWEDGIVVAVDAKDGMVAVEGWAETSDMKATELAKAFEGCGVAAIIATDIGRDGMKTGVNVEYTAELASAVRIPIIASGGVASVEDINNLRAAKSTNPIAGSILGRALYDGAIDLTEALAALRQ